MNCYTGRRNRFSWSSYAGHVRLRQQHSGEWPWVTSHAQARSASYTSLRALVGAHKRTQVSTVTALPAHTNVSFTFCISRGGCYISAPVHIATGETAVLVNGAFEVVTNTSPRAMQTVACRGQNGVDGCSALCVCAVVGTCGLCC
jgi:hypothetical protein